MSKANAFIKEFETLQEENERLTKENKKLRGSIDKIATKVAKLLKGYMPIAKRHGGRKGNVKRTEAIINFMNEHTSFRASDVLKAIGLPYVTGGVYTRIGKLAEQQGFTKEGKLWTKKKKLF